MQTIAFLGLGAMGARMAERLLDTDHRLVVYNRTVERAQPLVARGATLAATPREAAEDADLVLSMVRDDEASRAVWLDDASGALPALRSDAVAVEMSTLSPLAVEALGAEMAARGIAFLDAPVVGSRPHAESGALTFLVGGDADTLERARAVLDHLGGAVHHVGPVGAGAAMKLAVNALFATQAAALAETLGSLQQSGLAVRDAVAVLNALPTTSPAASRVGTLMAERAFAPNFPIHLVAKDLGYATDLAARSGLDGRVLPAVRSSFERAERAGHGGDDIVGIAQLFLEP